MTNPVQQVQRLGQSVWYDNIRRGLIQSGELQRLIDLGVSGVTSNPTIFEKAIAGSTDYDGALIALAEENRSTQELFEALAIGDIQAAADLLLPIYDRTSGADGYASLEVNPHLAHDMKGTIAEAHRLFDALERPNVMVKVPATAEGIPAVRRLIARGINVNVTLIFSLESYKQVCEAYIGGLEELGKSGGDLSKVASVASFFVSRVDTAVDSLLEERVRHGHEEVESLMGRAAIANARLAYRAFQSTFGDERFGVLRAKGARVQRPLWASTGTKNPDYSDVLYVEQLIGPDTVNTMPEATLTSFLEHGRAALALEVDIDGAHQAMNALATAGVSMEDVTTRLLVDGVRAFADSHDQLLANLEDKKARLLAPEKSPVPFISKGRSGGISLGDHIPDVEATLAGLRQRDVIGRIWRRDPTVWSPDPTEITDRLGWLTVTDLMCDQVAALEAFSDEVRYAGYRHVVLLGMGGSSLGPEVLRQTFSAGSGQALGGATAYPELIVLDSTVPVWVQAVTDAIDPSKTLFLVSSKSGSTIEPNTFYAHFRALLDGVVGKERAGQNFVAITDRGTSLDRMAQDQGFRRVFRNPPDIGGRYSVLSYFGLAPAALSGVDIRALLGRADCMREGCASCVAPQDNPGAWLGSVMGTLAKKGRNKLTLITSPAISGFGLWVEQLLAESTGKEGKGIIPIAGEPLTAPNSYGDDRLFVYLRLEGDDNSDTDPSVDRLQASGQPVVRLELRDTYDLGAEFYRWEFATAVAGSVLGINPFDQPNVQSAKDMTDRVLEGYQRDGRFPPLVPESSITDLLAGAHAGDYLAIMAYVRQTPEVDQALLALRKNVMERHRIATTLGYGPRFLHSTGQLHKGGPAQGLFLQLTGEHQEDVSIPHQPYTFGVLADAQALGDFQALQASGRPVARVLLGTDNSSDILKLVGKLA